MSEETGAAPEPSPPAGRSSDLGLTADAYDAVAMEYSEAMREEIQSLPLERGMLTAFAELSRATGEGPVLDAGCGPGRLTAYLRELGVDAFGIDLSPAMIEIAGKAYPDLRFEVGSMDSLNLLDGELSGVLAWYSIIHAPPRELPAYFAEFHRVLMPGGHLLISFFESEDDPMAAFDHKVTMAFRWPVDALAGVAERAGFFEVGRMLRRPGEGERHRRGHLLMRRG